MYTDLDQRFLQHYGEFLARYSTNSAAQQYAELTLHARVEAAASYRAILAAHEAGQDITTAVLTRLLPHADTAANRERRAWIHSNPGLSGDVMRRHEQLGWAQPHEWPQRAAAILTFVRTCVEDPADLVAACLRFRQSPYTTGFQSGTLSPILNALRPEHFVTIHRKSLRVVNFFGRHSFTQDLHDYAAANAAAWTLIDRIGESGAAPPTLDLSPVDRFDLFCHWLVSVERFSFRRTRYWLVHLDEDTQWDAWRSGGFMALGYDELGDLSDLSRADFNVLRDQVAAQTPSASKRSVDPLWSFANQMEEGDLVAAYNNQGDVLGIGTVSGFYYFVPDVHRGHCRPVEWTDPQRRHAADLLQQRRQFQSVSQDSFYALAAAPVVTDRRDPAIQQAPTDIPPRQDHTISAARIQESSPPYAAAASQGDSLPPLSIAQIATESGFSQMQLAQWVDAIERKGQAIFYGPPGTGKSYMAAQLALNLAGGDDGFVERVQFHPSYAYEDFVQGIRPLAEADGRLTYRVMPGLFLRFCAEAARRRGRCVLLIDEINRADLARVFGEVMQLLEYRDQPLALAAGGHLRIPANVRILGTMNTADRSIALVDAALRRRFAFLALYPDYDILRHFHHRHATGFPVDRLVAVLRRLNRQIGDADYTLGITFFLRTDLSATLPAIWQTEVEPYLEAYFFDRVEQVAPFRWSALREEILDNPSSVGGLA